MPRHRLIPLLLTAGFLASACSASDERRNDPNTGAPPADGGTAHTASSTRWSSRVMSCSSS